MGWTFCPQFISLKILRTHFTAHTWLNWSYTLYQCQDFFNMILKPRTHLKTIPLRATGLLTLWFSRWLSLKIFSKEFYATLTHYSSYMLIGLIPIQMISLGLGIVGVSSGSLGWNPLLWEEKCLENERKSLELLKKKSG